MYQLNKFSLVILTRCNLRCKLCCEYVPQNKAFPDMTVEEANRILTALFSVVDHVKTLHLTGGGEPFLHPALPELVETAMEFQEKFDRLMLFTNCTIPPSEKLMAVLRRYPEKILVQVSRYGVRHEVEPTVLKQLEGTGVQLKVEKYYGDDQSFGGWVDFGPWTAQKQPTEVLELRFKSCAVTGIMCGNWRTRDGKVHWCSRSQRGMDLGLLPDHPEDYVDLFDTSTAEEKRQKFDKIASTKCLMACDYCSGDQGTNDVQKRYPAAEQL